MASPLTPPARDRSRAFPSERRVERDLALHADLVGRHAPLEKVRDLLDVLKVHEGEGVLRPVGLAETEGREPLIGDELQVAPPARRSSAKATSQSIASPIISRTLASRSASKSSGSSRRTISTTTNANFM